MDPMDKAAYAEQKRQEKQQYNDELSKAMTSMCRDVEKLQMYLEVQGRMPGYSVGNAIMIARQYPAASQVKLSTEWADIGVKPLRGVTGISILVPGKQYPRQDGSMAQGYDVRKAFDVTQTSAGSNYHPRRPTNNDLLRTVLDYQKGAWLFKTVDEGEPAHYYPEQNTIVIRKQQQFTPLFSALVMEVVCADLLLRKGLQRVDSEPMAACVTWMVCSRYMVEPSGISLPDPVTVMGDDPQSYRKRLSSLTDPLRSMVNFMEQRLAKLQREREATL